MVIAPAGNIYINVVHGHLFKGEILCVVVSGGSRGEKAARARAGEGLLSGVSSSRARTPIMLYNARLLFVHVGVHSCTDDEAGALAK